MDKKRISHSSRAPRSRQDPRAEACRLTIHRTPRHIYAQVIAPGWCAVVGDPHRRRKGGARHRSHGPATSMRPLRSGSRRGARDPWKKGIDTVAFDRSGFRYHGRVKALADAAREAG
jgi:large subunit ribosomal protein L18